MGSQEYIAQMLQTNISTSLLANSHCRKQLYQIVCNYYLPSCGTNGSNVPPLSICREECSVVMDACPIEWKQLHLQYQRFINCNDTSSLLYPLPNCCTSAGIETERGTESTQPGKKS